MGPECYFMEVPIYRVSEKRFYRDYQRDLEAHLESLWPPNTPPEILAELRPLAEVHFWKRYGGPWQFNQAVGWIRLYLLGNQFRGELWFISAKSLVRRPAHKRLEQSGKAFEYHPGPDDQSATIASTIRERLVEAVNEYRRGKLKLDLECFDNLAAYIDWRALSVRKHG